MKNIYKFVFSAAAMLFGYGLFAQNYVHQVIVVNEGQYDYINAVQVTPVSFGSYDPTSGVYTQIADIPDVRFASDVKVDEDYIYIAADTLLVVYDIDTYQLVHSAVVPGIRKVALWNDQILLTKGEFGGFDHYFETRYKSDLSIVYELDSVNGPQYSSENVVVVGDYAYVGVGNAFEWGNYVGRIGKVDLLSQTYLGFTDLGPNGTNPENIMVSGNALYTLNNKDYSGSSVSKVNLSSGVNEYTEDIALNAGCGTSALANDMVYYQEYGVDKLARFDVNTQSVVDTLANSISYYAVHHDVTNDLLYATSTDFVAQGDLSVLDLSGNVMSTTSVGVAPGPIAFDIRMSTAIQESELLDLTLAPNPGNGLVRIQCEKTVNGYEVQDLNGRVVRTSSAKSSNFVLDVNDLRSGVYIIKLEVEGKEISERLMIN